MSTTDRRQQWLDHAQAASRPDGDTPNAALLAELRKLNASPIIRHPKSTIAWALALWAPLLALAIIGGCVSAAWILAIVIEGLAHK